jgi:hypothetical protein
MKRTFRWALLLLAALASELPGQESADSEAMLVSVPLRADHWAVVAARRAHALGLADDYLPAQRAVPLAEVRRVLQEATHRAWSERPEWAELLAEWEHRFEREFPRISMAPEAVSNPGVQHAAIGVASGWRNGVARAGQGLFPPYEIEVLADRAEIGVQGTVIGSVFRRMHVLLAPEITSAGGLRGEWDVTLAGRAVALSAGRQPVLYGGGERAVVLGSPEPWHRVQLETVHPLALPGPLRHLGLTAFHTSLGRIGSDRHPGDPFFWTASASIRPHRRFTLAAHRAAIFGGASVETPFTLWNFVRLAGGLHTADFENQVVSLEARFRLPTEPLLPLSAYVDWGFDDSAGAIRDVPGYVAGIFAPALPGMPRMSFGVERASFAHSCCGNPPWYRHAAFPGGWAHRDLPLGHPLGGEGTESLAWMRSDGRRLPVSLEWRGWKRHRGPENLYTPIRQGKSWGTAGGLRWWGWNRTDAHLTLSREAGSEWSETQLQAGLTRFF